MAKREGAKQGEARLKGKVGERTQTGRIDAWMAALEPPGKPRRDGKR